MRPLFEDTPLPIGDRTPGSPTISGVLYELPGWAHYIWLIYLGFLFTPLLSPDHGGWLWFWPTLLSVPIFVYLYSRIIRGFRHKVIPGPGALPEVLAIAAMAYALMYFNDSANTYLIYCVAVAPFTVHRLWRFAVLVVVLIGLYGLNLLVLGFKPVMFGITAVVGMAAAASNYMLVQNRRKNAMLRVSREEVHRLGRVAERERIGRDLHDLLGHTLSLIAIKSELAAKLIDRDRAAAAREVAEVTNIAREALKQVRTAVSGIRAAALENEVASARTLLHTAGVTLTFERDDGMLSPELETALAMIVREAATNIHRHSSAQNATIEVRTETAAADSSRSSGERTIFLSISDDGRGGVTAHGNGLSGIRERVRSLAGTLEIESPRGRGTTLRVRLPLATSASDGRARSTTGPASEARVGEAASAGTSEPQMAGVGAPAANSARQALAVWDAAAARSVGAGTSSAIAGRPAQAGAGAAAERSAAVEVSGAVAGRQARASSGVDTPVPQGAGPADVDMLRPAVEGGPKAEGDGLVELGELSRAVRT